MKIGKIIAAVLLICAINQKSAACEPASYTREGPGCSNKSDIKYYCEGKAECCSGSSPRQNPQCHRVSKFIN